MSRFSGLLGYEVGGGRVPGDDGLIDKGNGWGMVVDLGGRGARTAVGEELLGCKWAAECGGGDVA